MNPRYRLALFITMLFAAVILVGITCALVWRDARPDLAARRVRGGAGARQTQIEEGRSTQGTGSSQTVSQPPTPAAAGTTFETTITTDGVGKILVQVELPSTARFSDGAPVLVNIPTYFTPETSGFHPLAGVEGEGMISLSFMYPGRSDGAGKSSEGTDDYGGANSIKATRDVLLFAMGKKANSDGWYLKDLSSIVPLSTDVGIYAFSHPGIMAMAALGTYPTELSGIAFFVGRENPTLDLLSSMELGYWNSSSGKQAPVVNPLYSYPADFGDSAITLDYSTVQYDSVEKAPYFDTNKNGVHDASEFALGTQVPKMFGKRYYSSDLLHALLENHALTTTNWPTDLATPEEADATWPSRETNTYYPKLQGLSTHTMLIFSKEDHVQVVQDKPHIHQAFDGLRAAGLWVRLNPDAAYVAAANEGIAKTFTEHAANTAPSDWSKVSDWAFNGTGAATAIFPLEGVAEMADRVHAGDWSTNLSVVLAR